MPSEPSKTVPLQWPQGTEQAKASEKSCSLDLALALFHAGSHGALLSGSSWSFGKHEAVIGSETSVPSAFKWGHEYSAGWGYVGMCILNAHLAWSP